MESRVARPKGDQNLRMLKKDKLFNLILLRYFEVCKLSREILAQMDTGHLQAGQKMSRWTKNVQVDKKCMHQMDMPIDGKV